MSFSSPSVLFINPNWENFALVCSYIKSGYSVIGYGPTLDLRYRSLDSFHHIIGQISDYKSIFDISQLYSIEAIASDNCDYSLLTSEVMSDLLGLPSFGTAAARVSNNKYNQRKLASKDNIKQPRYSSCASIQDVRQFLEYINGPAMLKPVDSRGSMGISYLDLEASDLDLANAISLCLTSSPSGEFLVEEYITGELFTIDGFSADGDLSLVGIAARQRSGSGNIVTKQILYDKSYPSQFLEKAYLFLKQVHSSLGYMHGHVHCEALLSPSGDFYLVECTNRGAGVFTSSTINPYVSSIDLNLEYIKIKSGKSVALPSGTQSLKSSVQPVTGNQNSASLIFPDLGLDGQILERFDYDSIRSLDLVLDVQLFAAIGKPLPVSVDGPTRHYAIALKTSDLSQISVIVQTINNEFVSVL